MRITFCWDDGAIEDVKLMELHKEYSVPGIFFVPTENCEGRDTLSPEVIEKSASDLISFGGHTEHHVYLTKIPIENVRQEIVGNKEYLANILGHDIQHFCLPGGKYNKDILDIAYKEFKTVRTADTMCFSSNGNLIKPTFHMYMRGKIGLLYNGMKNRSIDEMMVICRNCNLNYWDIINKLIDYENENDNADIIIWGHSWEIEQFGLWNEVERIFKHVADDYYQKCVSYDSFCKSVNENKKNNRDVVL